MLSNQPSKLLARYASLRILDCALDHCLNYLTADNVTITGASSSLPYSPLMDSFDEYMEDSWTYDGRCVCNGSVNILSEVHAETRHCKSVIQEKLATDN